MPLVVIVIIIAVNITKFINHYHVVILKIVIVTMFCSDVHYTIFTVQSAIRGVGDHLRQQKIP